MLLAGMTVTKVPNQASSSAEHKEQVCNSDTELKIKIPTSVGKAKIVEGAAKNEASDEIMMQLRELKIKLSFYEDRLEAKTAELKSAKEHLASQQAAHEAEKGEMRNTINELRAHLTAATTKASNLDGQLLIMKELTTLTKENAASSMSILYDRLRTGPGGAGPSM